MMSEMEKSMRSWSLAPVLLTLVALASGGCTPDGKDVQTDDTDVSDDTDPAPDDTDDDTDPTDTLDTDPSVDSDTDTDELPSDSDSDDDSFGGDTFAQDSNGGGPLPGDTGDTGGGGGPGPGPGPGGDDTDVGCGPLQVLDCEGVCGNELLLGDGTCHDGLLPGAPNFDCESFDNDEGDCQGDTDNLPCGDPLEIRDCAGVCYRQTFLGDGMCDDGSPHPWGDPNFACDLFNQDNGDCPILLP
jgi:hypothetical protein